MILDSSAMVAVVFQEETCEAMLQAMLSAKTLGAGTTTLVETAIVLSARMQAKF